MAVWANILCSTAQSIDLSIYADHLTTYLLTITSTVVGSSFLLLSRWWFIDPGERGGAPTASGRMASPPEQKLHVVEARIEQATSEGGATPEQLVEWRQECLALAQLACRADTGTPDKYQLGRACANLSTAYLATGANEAALRHAERAEALLLSQTGRPNSHPPARPGAPEEAQGGSQPRPAWCASLGPLAAWFAT